MSVAYVSQSQAKPGGADNLREFFRAVVAPAVRGSHGCESFNLLQGDTDPSNFMAVEDLGSRWSAPRIGEEHSAGEHCRFHATCRRAASWQLLSRAVMRVRRDHAFNGPAGAGLLRGNHWWRRAAKTATFARKAYPCSVFPL